MKSLYEDYYANAPFTWVLPGEADLKQVVNTNKCLISLEVVQGQLVVTSVIDNLLSVTHVDVAAQAVAFHRRLQGLDSGHGGVESLTVHGNDLALLEANLHGLVAGLGHGLKVGRFRKSLGGIQEFAAADGGAPKTHVVGILELGKIGREAVLVQVIGGASLPHH